MAVLEASTVGDLERLKSRYRVLKRLMISLIGRRGITTGP